MLKFDKPIYPAYVQVIDGRPTLSSVVETLRNLVGENWLLDNKLPAIRALREITGLGLAECKEAIEKVS